MRSAASPFHLRANACCVQFLTLEWPERHYRDKANRMDFLHNSLELIEHYMLLYGYSAVFFGVMLENAGVPVPGETILLIAGYYASAGHFHIALVMLVAATGAIVGDNIGFAIGHHYGRATLLRWGRFVFLTPKRFAH